jgi:N4-gp56 family major capsid protein
MHETKTILFRRYNSLPFTPNALTEGVTPPARSVTKTDITATLTQYGDLIELTDVVLMTHTDPVIQEFAGILGEQQANMMELVRFYVVRAGTNVIYGAPTASRGAVISPISATHIQRAVRTLKRGNARKITSVIRSTPSYNTFSVAPGYFAVCHSDLEGDIRAITGFKAMEDYGALPPLENELGKVNEVRFLTSSIFESWPDAGGAVGSNISTGNVASDVYPVLIFARDAWGFVPLKGEGAMTPMVRNPKPDSADPLAQRGHIGWKGFHTAVILNDAWMIRIEVACTN